MVQRSEEWRAARERGLLNAHKTATGADLSYVNTPQVAKELARLVEAEQQCCMPDAITWELIVSDDALTVRVETTAEVRDRVPIDVIFDVLRGESPD